MKEEKDIHWYDISIERVAYGNYGRDRFKLRIRLEAKVMYELIKQITDFCVSDAEDEEILTEKDVKRLEGEV